MFYCVFHVYLFLSLSLSLFNCNILKKMVIGSVFIEFRGKSLINYSLFVRKAALIVGGGGLGFARRIFSNKHDSVRSVNSDTISPTGTDRTNMAPANHAGT